MIISVNIDNLSLINEIQTTFNVLYKQKNELKKEFEMNPYTKIYIYIENDNILGILHINDIYDRYEINNIYVLEEYRNKGIASKLLEYVIELGKKNNILNITLEVRKNNVNAIKLYNKYNFKEKAIRKGYYNGIDGILMEKEMM
ncbi:MAG: GNAT family N-acetyltransferase [Bacilli bacterium]|nr:GNAT family N-acetyltransferase [Bacilli bacterium]